MTSLTLWQPIFSMALDDEPGTRDATVRAPQPLAATGAPDDDAELVRRVAGGDASAYRTLVERHLHGLHGFVYRMLGSRAEAEEVCQESFLRLWKEAHRYVARAKLSTWLYRIAHNLAVDRLRRRRETTSARELDEVAAAERPSSPLLETELVGVVQAALEALPERQRAALVLVHYQGMSNAEAAEVLGVKVRALESLLARGRRELRERLAPFQEGRLT